MNDLKLYHCSVDPGIRGTGFCIWPGTIETYKKRLREGVRLAPIYVENMYPSNDQDWTEASHTIFKKVVKLLDKYECVSMHSEFPQYFQSGEGHAATADGQIYKLAYMVGILAGICMEQNMAFHPVRVIDWKGQLPKEVVETRIKKRFEDSIKSLKVTSHGWDAVGIGMYSHGDLL